MTIYALSSGFVTSGVAVIRVSGKRASTVVKKLTQKDLPLPKVATLRKINNINTSELIDEGIILWFPGPNSYTGEDMAEFHVHGSKAVIQALLKSISEIKECRLAEPGEFTKIALQNNKINLLKAESIGDLIYSETEIQRKQAIKIIEGRSESVFNDLREELIKILSFIESKIDFPEEDLPKNILNEIEKISEKSLMKIKKILDDQKVGERIREGFKIAIVGPANAGKSSLLNYLSDRDVAIVSEFAGTTRDVIEVHLNIDGYPVVVSDTAGIREAQNEIEKKGIKLALKSAEEADLRLVVIEPKNLNFTGFLNDLFDKNSILVINKCDLSDFHLSDQFKKIDHVKISIKKKINIDKLILKIKNKLKNNFIITDDVLITRERHRQHLEQCMHHLLEFKKKQKIDNFDIAAEDLRLATRHLGMIVGKVDVEEILGSIFDQFCIGK